MSRGVERLSGAARSQQEQAAKEFYTAGVALALQARLIFQSAGLSDIIFGPPTVGIAVTPEHFEEIRKAWGLPALADVPAEHHAKEFYLAFADIHLDIIAPDGEDGADFKTKAVPASLTRPLRAFSPKKCGEGVIGKFLERFGEGIQQVEFLTKDVEAACEQLKTKGFKPIYEKPRPGADGALVNFVLVDLKNGRKILVEFVENKND